MAFPGGLIQKVNGQRPYPPLIGRIAYRADSVSCRMDSTVHRLKGNWVARAPVAFEEQVGVGDEVRIRQLDAGLATLCPVVEAERLVLGKGAAGEELAQRPTFDGEPLPSTPKARGNYSPILSTARPARAI